MLVDFKQMKISTKNALLYKICNLIISSFNNFKALLNKRILILIVSILISFNIIVYAFACYWTGHIFEIELSFFQAIILTIVYYFMGIVKIVPGNLGIYELASGGIFNLVGGTMEEGIIISLFIRLSGIVLTFTLGTFGVMHNLKYLKTSNIKTLFNKLRKTSLIS